MRRWDRFDFRCLIYCLVMQHLYDRFTQYLQAFLTITRKMSPYVITSCRNQSCINIAGPLLICYSDAAWPLLLCYTVREAHSGVSHLYLSKGRPTQGSPTYIFTHYQLTRTASLQTASTKHAPALFYHPSENVSRSVAVSGPDLSF